MKTRINKSFPHNRQSEFSCISAGTCSCINCNGANRDPADDCKCKPNYHENPPSLDCVPDSSGGSTDQCSQDLDCIIGTCVQGTCVPPPTQIPGTLTNETNGETYCQQGMFRDNTCMGTTVIGYCSQTDSGTPIFQCNCGFGKVVQQGDQRKCECIGNAFQVGGLEDSKLGSNQCICPDGFKWEGEFDDIKKQWISGTCVEMKKTPCADNSDCGDGKCDSGFCVFPKGCVREDNKCFCPPGTKVDIATNTCIEMTCKDDPSVCNGDLMTGTCDPSNQDKCACKANASMIDGKCVCNSGYVQQGSGTSAICEKISCANSGGDMFCGAGTCQGTQCVCNAQSKTPLQTLPEGQSCQCETGKTWNAQKQMCEKSKFKRIAYIDAAPGGVWGGTFDNMYKSMGGCDVPGGSENCFDVLVYSFILSNSIADSAGFIYNPCTWITDGPCAGTGSIEEKNKKARDMLLDKFHNAGQKVMYSAFGATWQPSSAEDPVTTCNRLAQIVLDTGVDGIDLDYESNEQMEGQCPKGAEWIIQCTKTIRDKLPVGKYILTHAPQAPYFNDQKICTTGQNKGYTYVNDQVGSLIDWYNIQFYGSITDTYNTYETIFENSNVPSTAAWNKDTAVKQLVDRGIPPEKIVVGKCSMNGAGCDPVITGNQLGEWSKKYNDSHESIGGMMIWQLSANGNGFLNQFNQSFI